MAIQHTFRDPDNFLLLALREDALETMHALMNRFEKTKIFTGRLLCVADSVFGKIDRTHDDVDESNIILRSAFLGGAAVADQTFKESPSITAKERAVTKIRSLCLPLENELIYPTSQEAARNVVMDIAVNSLKDQPALRVLAHEVGRTYGVNPDIHSQTTEAEYDAALMGVGYLAAVYSIAIQTRISIN